MKKLISILLIGCILLALSLPCPALAEEEYEEDSDIASYVFEMDYEPMPVMMFDQGVSIAVPIDFMRNEVSEDLAAQGVLYSFTSADEAFVLQIYYHAPAGPDDYLAKMIAAGVENMGWIDINDITYLIYTLPEQEHLFAVAFSAEEAFALNFAFITNDEDDLGELPYQILGTLSAI